MKPEGTVLDSTVGQFSEKFDVSPILVLRAPQILRAREMHRTQGIFRAEISKLNPDRGLIEAGLPTAAPRSPEARTLLFEGGEDLGGHDGDVRHERRVQVTTRLLSMEKEDRVRGLTFRPTPDSRSGRPL